MSVHFCTLPSRTHIYKYHRFFELSDKVLFPVQANVGFVRNSQNCLGSKVNLFEYYPVTQLRIFHMQIYKSLITEYTNFVTFQLIDINVYL
jgi:hypothetical protein